MEWPPDGHHIVIKPMPRHEKSSPSGEDLVGCLSSTFGNSAPKTKTLVNRLDVLPRDVVNAG